jgi:SET domain-containing protein
VRPNVEADDDGRFRALRTIRKGEELTADYRTFTDERLPFKPRGSRRARSAPKTGGKIRAGHAGR